MYNELIFRAKDGKERSQEEFFDAITRAFAEEGMDVDREDMRTALEDAKQYMKIVHCKDCKHRPVRKDYYCFDFPIKENGKPDCTCPVYLPPDDFFCAYGERKDDEL